MPSHKHSVFFTTCLQELFDDALAECHIVMFSAPAGCGKTTQARALLSSAGIPFSAYDAQDGDITKQIRSYLETHQRDAILIDSCEHITDEREQRAFVEIISAYATNLFVFCGRCPLPSWLAPFEANLDTFTVETDDFAFDEESLQRLCEENGIALDKDEAKTVLERTAGYPVAITLMVELLRKRTLGNAHTAPFTDEIFDLLRERLFLFCHDQVFKNLADDEKNLLLSVAPFEQFDNDLAEMLTDNVHSSQVIAHLKDSTSIFPSGATKTMTLFPFFRRYLLWEAQRSWDSEERGDVFTRAGQHYESTGDLAHAAQCYALADDHDAVIRILTYNTRLSPHQGYYRELSPYYLALEDAEICSSLDLMVGMSMLQMLLGNFEQSNRWYDELHRHSPLLDLPPQQDRELRSRLCYLDISLPQRSIGQTEGFILNTSDSIATGELDLTPYSLSATGGLPSILNGSHDFSPWVKRDQQLYRTMSTPVAYLLGSGGVGLPYCAYMESRFEKGEDVSASTMRLIANIPEIERKGTPDIEFATVGLIARIQVSRGRIDDARLTMEELRSRFEKRGENCFIANINAASTRIALYRNDRKTWCRWLEMHAPTNMLTPFASDYYIYQTYFLAELAEGNDEHVLLGQVPWHQILTECHRSIDLIHLCAITSIALSRKDQRSRMSSDTADANWQQMLSRALDLASKFNYIRPLSQYGIAILPLIEDSSWKKKPDYMKRLLADTRLQAAIYPQFLHAPVRLAEPLTSTEQKVVRLLASDLSNARIGEILDIKVSTVKTHVGHIMRKLGVTSRAQAKTRAIELGLTTT